ncbi:hypothetical protein LOS78_01820 [Paracoccus sp. MA]|uniref:hypothetical protein n=1 Tax=Paracoccus sp. MA TaxID=2895796 RepID=UPI001E4A5992|nr:hypothetical protein [Paracoccus sp. MA]UFM64237.1 hypothetical protein LOS78_01820 [Paracoccus sp. MA]
MKITRVRTDAPILVRIGPDVTVYIHKIGERAKLAVDAPRDLDIQIDTGDALRGGTQHPRSD